MDSEFRRLERLAQEGNANALIQWNQLRQRKGYPPYLPAIAAHIKILEQELSQLQNCVNSDNVKEVLAETFFEFFQKNGKVIPRIFWSLVWQHQIVGAPIVNSLVFEDDNIRWYRNVMGASHRWDQDDVNWGREYQAGRELPEYASTQKLLDMATQKLTTLDKETQEFQKWNSLQTALTELEAIFKMMKPILVNGAVASYLQKFFPVNTSGAASEVSQEILDLRRSNALFNFYLLPDRIVVEQRSHMLPPIFEPRILEVTLYQDL